MKSTRFLLGAAPLAALFFADAAFAQEGHMVDYSSPQHFAAELRMGLYYPKVDNEFGATAPDGTKYDNSQQSTSKPFHHAFGSNPRVFIGGEFDWQVYRIPYVGTIGPGLGIQYLKFGRPALLDSGKPSAEDTSLQIFPMYLQAVLRVDVLSREVGIPIVPYVKGGLGVAAWRMTNGSGTAKITHKDDEGHDVVDSVGKGVSYGPQFAIGGMLLLDWLDEYAASQADASIGINNTYLFAEYFMSSLNNVHGTGLQLGTSNVSFGLAFEF